eukprot:Clim_evm26s7 gene=Clim_evmTU26s7
MVEFREFEKSAERFMMSENLTSLAFRHLDTNGDGYLSFVEWLHCVHPYASGNLAYALTTEPPKPRGVLTEAHKAAFRVYDDDRSGTVNLSELSSALGDLGYTMAELKD